MKNKTAKRSVIKQEVPDRAPKGWAGVQESIAQSSGLALLLVDGYQPPALVVASNNSICNALQSSPDYVGLCDPYCGAAHIRVTGANSIIHYRCHAGVQSFAVPVEIEEQRPLAVIGSQAFENGSDYQALVERLRTGYLL